MASIPISKALPIFPFVAYQYLISSGTTWINATLGSLESPLCTPSFRSPNQAEVLHKGHGLMSILQNIGGSLRSWPIFLDLFVIIDNFGFSWEATTPLIKSPWSICSQFCNSRGPVGSGRIQEADIDMRVVLNFFEFVRNVVCDKGQCQLCFGNCWSVHG